MANKRRSDGEGQVYKDGDGWRVVVDLGTYCRETGRKEVRKVRVKGTKTEALAVLRKLRREADAGRLSRATGMTLEAYLTRWLEDIGLRRAANTYRQYQWLVRDHIVPALGRKLIDKVTRQDVQRLIDSKAAAGLSWNSLRLIRAVIHAAYRDAARDSVAAVNPAEFVEVPKVKKSAPTFLKPEDAMKLRAAVAGTELGALFLFMLQTGARIGEATGVRWQDLDLVRGEARISGQLQRVGGVLQRVESTKTHRDRLLPLSPGVVEALRQERARQAVQGDIDPDGLAFLNAEGRRVDPKLAWKRLRQACQEAGIPEISPHKLRHTAATLMLAETGDLHGVQKLLGHQQVNLTADLYGHATADTLRHLSDAFEKATRKQ